MDLEPTNHEESLEEGYKMQYNGPTELIAPAAKAVVKGVTYVFEGDVCIHINNASKCRMTSPETYTKYGYVHEPPPPMIPDGSECEMVVKNNWIGHSGSKGGVSWLMKTGERTEVRLVILWSVPARKPNRKGNMIACVIAKVGVKVVDLLDNVGDESKRKNLGEVDVFRHGKGEMKSVECRSDGIALSATIGEGPVTKAKIIVYNYIKK